MKAADAIAQVARTLYLSGGASSKRTAASSAETIVADLVDAGALVLDDLKPRPDHAHGTRPDLYVATCPACAEIAVEADRQARSR